jgi:hypothetical protein
LVIDCVMFWIMVGVFTLTGHNYPTSLLLGIVCLIITNQAEWRRKGATNDD